MANVYLSIGSNIGERERYLQFALDALAAYEEITVERASSIYETAPVGYVDQDDFLNIAVQVTTTLPPLELLDVCQQIEKEGDRQRVVRWGPRTLDIDVLLYDDQCLTTERLILPHPRMTERAFVLVPLAEIAPDVVEPTTQQRIAELAQRVEGDVQKIKEGE